MIIVDTDVLIEILDRGSKRGEEALEKILATQEPICITAINLHEILYGLYKFAKPIDEILKIPVLSYTGKDAQLAARIELEMEKRGKAIRRTDAMIAAIAINNGAKLYTFNLKHFKPIEALGLKILS